MIELLGFLAWRAACYKAVCVIQWLRSNCPVTVPITILHLTNHITMSLLNMLYLRRAPIGLNGPAIAGHTIGAGIVLVTTILERLSSCLTSRRETGLTDR